MGILADVILIGDSKVQTLIAHLLEILIQF
jgi:hypothetical protein